MAFIRTPWEALISWLARMEPSRREIFLAALALVLLFAVGTAGYVLLEGWSVADGFYMTFITLSTIGFQEVSPLSHVGRFFTFGLGTTGIGILSFVAVRSAQLLLVSDRLRERRIMKRIDALSGHYVVCGYGRVGERLTEDLIREGETVVVVDTDEEICASLSEAERLHVQGDAEDEGTLRAAGIERARGLILTLPEDSSNVFVALTAREMNPDLFVLARTIDHDNRSKLRNAGADKVIAPSEVGADRMAQVVLRPHTDDFLERVLHTSALSRQIDEVQIHKNAPLAEQTLAESNFRQQFDAIVIGIIDADTGAMTFNPSPTERIDAGDILIVLGETEIIDALRERVCLP
ncbi:potassium channel family protein [Salinibacter ruber]|uniref:potassium channel family protein n=1 Tax=Salinibacter ruber TaxID=146919 RepID=UPI00216977B0|nr:potassium channel protein [Salinibacter ruber]MCS4200839.1 voltage-gated potassium channel [Salinibacter ruber]